MWLRLNHVKLNKNPHALFWDLIFFISFIPDLLVAPGQYSYTHSTKSSHSTEFSHNSSSFILIQVQINMLTKMSQIDWITVVFGGPLLVSEGHRKYFHHIFTSNSNDTSISKMLQISDFREFSLLLYPAGSELNNIQLRVWWKFLAA